MGFEESWRRTREHLLEARRRLSANLVPGEEGGRLASFEEYLDYNELQLAMEELETIAESHRAPFSFWRQMRHAAEEMQLKEVCALYTARCLMLPLATDLAIQLQAGLLEHPLYLKAKAQSYFCGPHFLLFEASEIERLHIGTEEKQRLREISARSGEPVICMYFLTAEETPEPLAGHGEMFAFFFDPEFLQPLAVDVSGWRS